MSDKRVVEVYRAENGAQAHRFVTLLEEAGIKAEVQSDILDTSTTTGTTLFGSSNPWWNAPRILVHAEDAEKARRLVLELEQRERDRAQVLEQAPAIAVVCEECGNTTAFPEAQRGTVQECPSCRSYLDVGEEDEGEWEADTRGESEE